MKRKIPLHHPFDKFFKSMLTLRRAVEELLAYCLPETVRNALDWSSLKPVKDSYVDEHLHESFADVVYTCGTISDAEVRVCFLFEHKSDKPAGAVALQILRYMLNIWESDTRQKRQPGPVVPIVIYHGHEPWEKEKLKSLVHPSGAFEPYLPDFDFIFLNLRTTSDAELLAPGSSLLQAFLLLLKYAREEYFLRRNFARIVIFAEQRTDPVEFTFFYKLMLKYVISISSITKQEIHAMIDETKDDDYLRFGENDHEVSLLHLLYDEDEIEEMKQQGLQEGRQQVVQQAKKEVILSVLNKQPDWTDKMIAELLDVPEELVREVRAERAAG